MNWLLLLYFLEIGYSPFYESLNSNNNNEYLQTSKSIYYIVLDSEVVILNHLFIGGALKTYISPINNSYQYVPFEADYLFKAGLRFDNLELGFRHLCLHPVRPYEMYYQPQGSTDASYEEFYIKISGKY